MVSGDERKTRWKKEYNESERNAPSVLKIVGIVLVVIALGAAYVYFTIISPVVEKPFIEKPVLMEGQGIEEKHVEWIVNELGAYKIHSFNNEEAEFELVVEGVAFAVTTENGIPKAAKRNPGSPDLRITTGYSDFADLMNADDMKTEMLELYNNGDIGIEVLKDEATLALKGYKAIYDEVTT